MLARRPTLRHATFALTLVLAAAWTLGTADARGTRGTYRVRRSKAAPSHDALRPTRQGITWAAKRISKHMKPTPLVHSPELSKQYGVEVYLKLESATAVGSFKIRGALNTVLSLPAKTRAKGVIAASTGNHAQGVAFAAKQSGVPATIVMPEGASPLKAEKTRKLGAKVVLAGENFGKAVQIAEGMAKEQKRFFVPAYENKRVIEGQGTIGREILKQLPDADWVISALGGGGLMGGISTAGHGKKHRPVFIGVQSENNAPMFETLRRSAKYQPRTVDIKKTLADGTLVTSTPSTKMVELLRSRVDLVVKVSEKATGRAVLELLDRTGNRIEGAGALPLAGLDRALKDLSRVKSLKKIDRPKKVVLVLSGGNIDQAKLDALRQHKDPLAAH